ncbi:MAG TPA: MFS transporter [Tepidisphaeraceae bacterium]
MADSDERDLMAARTEATARLVNDSSEGATAVGAAMAADRAHIGTQKVGSFRWVVCGLLFYATTVNYMDRQVLSLLAPYLQKVAGWNELHYAYINMAFMFSYAIGFALVGPFLDKVGTRIGYAASTIFWAIASMLHSIASHWGWMGFVAARFLLGLGESGNFPAAIKTTAEWFPKKERALATGVFNSGSNLGIIISAIMVPVVADFLGWRYAFLITGGFDIIWVILWLAFYRRPEEQPKLGKKELEYIRSDPPDPPVRVAWRRLFPHRATWAFCFGKFMTDPVWWFFALWSPKFFATTYHVTLGGLALPMVVIYLAADVGSIGGGWISSTLIHRGWSVNAGRKIAMLICAACVTPMFFAASVHQLWLSTAMIAMAAASHQGWSANLFTLASDTFPRRATGSVVGLGGFAGAIGGIIAFFCIGHVLQSLHEDYVPLLRVGACIYLFTLLMIHLLSPRLEPVSAEQLVAQP